MSLNLEENKDTEMMTLMSIDKMSTRWIILKDLMIDTHNWLNEFKILKILSLTIYKWRVEEDQRKAKLPKASKVEASRSKQALWKRS